MPKHIPSHLKTDRELRDWAFARIDELEHEIALYRADEAHEADDLFTGFVSVMLGLPRSVARMVVVLHRARVPVTKESLWRAVKVRDGDGDPEFKVTNVYASHARKVMGSDAITTVWGVGYGLTPKGRAQIDDLKAAFERARAA